MEKVNSNQWVKYVPEIIKELNTLQSLPKRGLLAGGSLANKIWEKVTGKQMPVNDIDIFTYGGHLEPNGDLDKNRYTKYTWVQKDKAKKLDTYSGIKYESKHNKCYRIEEHAREGLLNTVSYLANTTDYNLIIESFDINCTQVGYDLQTNELFYTQHFNDFINTAELKVVCANTPCHTAIRLLKKRDELYAKLDKSIEFKYLSVARTQTFENYIRHFFGEKYMDMIKLEWIEELSQENIYIKSVDTSGWKSPGKMWTFRTHKESLKEEGDFLLKEHDIRYSNEGVRHLRSLDDLNFYMRNVYGDKAKEEIWSYFGQMWSRNRDYVNNIPHIDDIKWLCTYYYNTPQIEITLDGLTFDEQISIVRRLETLTDVETTSGILKVCKISNINISDDDVLLMSLKARRIISENRRYAKQTEYFSI